MARPKPEYLLFDLNETLLDLTVLRSSVGRALEGDSDTVALWFETLLHYSLAESAAGTYHPFGEIGAAALVMVARNRGIALTMEEAGSVLSPIRSAPPHPEVPDALALLHRRGYRMGVLTNSPPETLRIQLANAGIAGRFDPKLSVEECGMYKPHRQVYRWAAGRLDLPPEKILFVAAHGWDIAGARAAGLQTAFLERPGQQTYPLADDPGYRATDLERLTKLL